MDYNKRTLSALTYIIALFFMIIIAIASGLWVLSNMIFSDDSLLLYATWTVATVALIGILARILAKITYKPLQTIFEAIVFAGHSSRGGMAPNTEKLRLGRELITSLARQVYDLASMSKDSQAVVQGSEHVETAPSTTTSSAETMLDHIGLPVIGIDSKQNITVINRTACEYIARNKVDVIGKPLYDAMTLSFQGDETFEQWLTKSQENTAVGNRVWERVRTIDAEGNTSKQFDLVASFSKDNQSGTETMLAIYDRSEQYFRDDGEISFVSLAVHELRTPLTVMHGYIEVFQDEIGPSLNPELAGFMHKMKASAQQLTAFVGNILNVARIEENQLALKLLQYNWTDIINYAVADLELRARVKNKHIEVKTAENLPSVAVDRISIHEVINNLVDNAIKYSGDSEKITISSVLNAEGMVEVSVQDYGIGVPSAVMPDLFQKFYRSHKSSVQVGGTGLGLYLCKALVNAHGGNIWVRSKEGEGAIFSFTIQPYDNVKHEKVDGQSGIMRGAHGWIKNHSLNRQ